MSRILIDLDGTEHDLDSPGFDLESLREKGLMPEDYELCGTCGYDHEYDWISCYEEIRKAHENTF